MGGARPGGRRKHESGDKKLTSVEGATSKGTAGREVMNGPSPASTWPLAKEQTAHEAECEDES